MSKDPTASQYNTIRWKPSVQTHRPTRIISNSNHDKEILYISLLSATKRNSGMAQVQTDSSDSQLGHSAQRARELPARQFSLQQCTVIWRILKHHRWKMRHRVKETDWAGQFCPHLGDRTLLSLELASLPPLEICMIKFRWQNWNVTQKGLGKWSTR